MLWGWWVYCCLLTEWTNWMKIRDGSCEKMIKYLKIHPAAKCLVTSRPHSTMVVTDILDQEGIPYQTMEIEELRSHVHQKELLESICTNSKEIAAPLAKLDIDLPCPVHLALFGYFYSSDPTSVNSWTSSIQMTKNILSHNSKTPEKSLIQRTIQNADLIVEEILQRICRVSYISLCLGKLSLKKNFYDAIKKVTSNSLGRDIPYDRVLSCFLKPTKSHNEPSYQFYHKTQQELMAGTYLAKKIAEDTGHSFHFMGFTFARSFLRKQEQKSPCAMFWRSKNQNRGYQQKGKWLF